MPQYRGSYVPTLRAGTKNRNITASYDYATANYSYCPSSRTVFFVISLKVHIGESGEFCNFSLPPGLFPLVAGQSLIVSEISYLLNSTEVAVKVQTEDANTTIPEGRIMNGGGGSRVQVKSAASITNPSTTGYWAWLKASGVYLYTTKN